MSGLLLEESSCWDLIDIAINDNAIALEEMIKTKCIADGTFWSQHKTVPQILLNYPPVICVCAFFGATNCIDKLIQYNATLEEPDLFGRNIAHFAVCCKETKQSTAFLRKLDKDLLNKVDNNGDTPLHYAAMFGRIENIKNIISVLGNESLQIRNSFNETPLMTAIKFNQNKLVKYLMNETSEAISKQKEELFITAISSGNMKYTECIGAMLNDDQKKKKEYVLKSIESKSIECFNYVEDFNNDYTEDVLIKALEQNCFNIVKTILKRTDFVTPKTISFAYFNNEIVYLKILLAYSESSSLSSIIRVDTEEKIPFIYDKIKLFIKKGWSVDTEFLKNCCRSFYQIFPLLFKMKVRFDIQAILPYIIKGIVYHGIDERYIDLFFNNGAKFTSDVLHHLTESICADVDFLPVLEYIDSGHWVNFGVDDELDQIGLLECTMSAPFLNFIFQFNPRIPFTDEYLESLTYRMLYKTTTESFIILLDHGCIDMQFDSEVNSFIVILFEQDKIYEAENLMKKYTCYLDKHLIEKNQLLEIAVREENTYIVQELLKYSPNSDKNFILKHSLYAFDELWKLVYPMLKGIDCRDVAIVETFSPKFSLKSRERLGSIGFNADEVLSDGNKMVKIYEEKKNGLSPQRTQTYISQSQAQSRAQSQAPSPVKKRKWIRHSENFFSNSLFVDQ